MKVGTTEKIKFKRTKRAFGLPLWQAVGLIESVWMAAYQNAPAGDIGKMSNEDIAAAIEWEGSPDELIAQLVKDGWIDEDEEFRLIVHDWSDHVAQFLKGAFAKHGKLFADQAAKQRAKQPAKQNVEQPAKDVLSTLPPIQFNSSQSDPSQEPPKAPFGRFTKPTLEEVTAYCLERQNTVEPQGFLDFYDSKGWMIGKSPMKDWRAAVRTWEKNGHGPKKDRVATKEDAKNWVP